MEIPSLYAHCIKNIRKNFDAKKYRKLSEKSRKMISRRLFTERKYFYELFDEEYPYDAHLRDFKISDVVQRNVFCVELTTTKVNVKDVVKMIEVYPNLSNIKILRLTSSENNPLLPFLPNNIKSFSLLEYDDPDLLHSLFMTGFDKITFLQLFRSKFFNKSTIFKNNTLKIMEKLKHIEFYNVIIIDFEEFSKNLNSPESLCYFEVTNFNSHEKRYLDTNSICRLFEKTENLTFLGLSGYIIDVQKVTDRMDKKGLKKLQIRNVLRFSANIIETNDRELAVNNLVSSVYNRQGEIMVEILSEFGNTKIQNIILNRFLRLVYENNQFDYTDSQIIMYIINKITKTFQISYFNHCLIYDIIQEALEGHVINEEEKEACTPDYSKSLLILKPWETSIFLPSLSFVLKKISFSYVPGDYQNECYYIMKSMSTEFLTHLGYSGLVKFCVERFDKSTYDDIEKLRILIRLLNNNEKNVNLFVDLNGIAQIHDFFKSEVLNFFDDEFLIFTIIQVVEALVKFPKARGLLATCGVIEDILNPDYKGEFFEEEYYIWSCMCLILGDPNYILPTFVNLDLGDLSPKEFIRNKIFEFIKEYPFEANCEIDSRSLLSKINLLNMNMDERIWLWVVWELANLTTKSPNEFMEILIPHNIIQKIENICLQSNLDEIHSYAAIFKRNYYNYIYHHL